jgi:hypothetical protein
VTWIVIFAVLTFALRRRFRSRERLAELEPTGIFRSPLFHLRTVLLLALLGLMISPNYLAHERWIVVAYVVAFAVVLAALLVVHRVLKWRYPI